MPEIGRWLGVLSIWAVPVLLFLITRMAKDQLIGVAPYAPLKLIGMLFFGGVLSMGGLHLGNWLWELGGPY